MFCDLALLPRRRRNHFQNRGRYDPTRRIGAFAVKHDNSLIGTLLPHDEPRRHRGADRQRALDLH